MNSALLNSFTARKKRSNAQISAPSATTIRFFCAAAGEGIAGFGKISSRCNIAAQKKRIVRFLGFSFERCFNLALPNLSGTTCSAQHAKFRAMRMIQFDRAKAFFERFTGFKLNVIPQQSTGQHGSL